MNNNISLNDELILSCAYRYAIGRHSYIVTIAPYIAQKYYNVLSDSRKQCISFDIISTINNCLFNYITYSASIPQEERNSLNDLLLWMKDNITCKNDFENISNIVVYKNIYEKSNKQYNIVKNDTGKNYKYESDLDDLIEWYNLAQVFNVKDHKIITIQNGNVNETIKVFKTWKKSVIEVNDKTGVFKYLPWKWEECYCDVDLYVKKGQCAYIENKYIHNIKL